jgi:hypothetical protein
LASALGIIRRDRRARAETLGCYISAIDTIAFQGIGHRVGSSFRKTLIIRFLCGALSTRMAFDGDAPIGRVALNDVGDLVHFASAVAGQIGTVELKIHIRQIDRHATAGFPCLDVSLFQLFDERAVLVNFGALLVNRALLLFLLVFLAQQLIADESAGA